MRWHGKFALIMNMYGSYGQDIYNGTQMVFLGVQGLPFQNISQSLYQQPVKESLANPVTFSSRYVQNGDYLKMSNLTLSYNIGDLNKDIKGLKIFITAQNLFIITRYPGFDPEVNVAGNINNIPSLGIDYLRYPSARSFVFGINFSL